MGIATLSSFIGAGGLGVFIQQGIARVYDDMILAGAVLVAFLAIFVDLFMALIERILTPKGLLVSRGQIK